MGDDNHWTQAELERFVVAWEKAPVFSVLRSQFPKHETAILMAKAAYLRQHDVPLKRFRKICAKSAIDYAALRKLVVKDA